MEVPKLDNGRMKNHSSSGNFWREPDKKIHTQRPARVSAEHLKIRWTHDDLACELLPSLIPERIINHGLESAREFLFADREDKRMAARAHGRVQTIFEPFLKGARRNRWHIHDARGMRTLIPSPKKRRANEPGFRRNETQCSNAYENDTCGNAEDQKGIFRWQAHAFVCGM